MAESANSLLRVQRSLFSMASVVQIGYTTLTQRFSDTLTSGCATRSVYPLNLLVSVV